MDKLVFRFSTSEDKPSNWASAAIRRLCHSPFSHVDFVLPDGNLLGASDQGPHSPCVAGNPQGVAIRPPNYQKFGIRRDMIIRTDRAEDVINAAKSQLGKPFDSSSLWDFLSDGHPGDRDWRNVEAWFCAEHKVWSCEQGQLWFHKLLWPKNRITPTDLLLLFLMDDRWENRDTFWQPIPGLQLDKGET